MLERSLACHREGTVGLNGDVSFTRKPVAPACSRGQYGLGRRGRGGTECTQTRPTTASRLTRPASTPQRSTCTTNAMPLPLLEWLERTGLSASDTGPRLVLSDFQDVHIATTGSRTRSCGCRTCCHRMCRHDQRFARGRRALGSAGIAACRGGRAGQVATEHRRDQRRDGRHRDDRPDKPPEHVGRHPGLRI